MFIYPNVIDGILRFWWCYKFTEDIESKMITTFLLYTPIKSNTSLNKFFSVVGVTCTNLLKARKASKNFCLYVLTESMTPLNVEVGVINLLKAREVE